MAEHVRVIAVEDDPDDAHHLAHLLSTLSDWQIDATMHLTPDDLTDSAIAECDVLILDFRLAGRTAADVITDLRARGLRVPTIVLTGHRGGSPAITAIRAGADDFLTKDELSRETLTRSLRYVLERGLIRHKLRLHAAILDAIGEAVAAVDASGCVSYWNRTAEQLYGFEASYALGLPLSTLLEQTNTETAREIIDAIRNYAAWSGEFLAPHRDGRVTPVHASTSPVRDESGRLLGVVAVALDISERKRAEEEAREHAEMYEALFNESPLPKIIVDVETLGFVGANNAAVEAYGYSREELLMMNVADLDADDDLGTIRARVAARVPGIRTHVGIRSVRRRDGSIVEIDMMSQRMRFGGREVQVTTLADVSAIREAERALHQSEMRLQQAQKMEAIGQLAGGVAHDFNNILTAIRGYADIIRLTLPRTSGVHGDLLEIGAAVDRAASLTQQLLAFSRRQVLKPTLIDTGAVVREMERLLRRLIGEHIELAVRVAAGAPLVRADRSQIEQVLINLVVNARDAMPRGGVLSIDVREVSLDDDFVEAHPGAHAGRCIALTVADNGSGMTPETRARAFEPFFTTKAPGRGTGLGLSTVYGIVKQSGGYIDIESAVDRGTRVTAYLPVVMEEAASGAVIAEDLPQPTPWGSATVLVAEDSAGVRAVLRRALESQGFHVLEAEDGRRAIEMATKHGGSIDLLIADLVMPRMGGCDLVHALRDIGRDMAIVLTSGYPSDSEVVGALPNGVTFLEKPFTAASLTTAVRNALDQFNRTTDALIERAN